MPVESIAWPQSGLRRVSVNSFGFGGTNSHVILDDALHYLESCGLRGFHHTTLSPRVAQRVEIHDGLHTNGQTNGVKTNGVNGTSTGHHFEDAQSLKSHPPRLLVWTAADANALQRMLEAHTPYVHTAAGKTDTLNELAYTLARRSHMLYRTHAVLESTQEESVVNGVDDANKSSTSPLPVTVSVKAESNLSSETVAFVFTGQGAQYTGMGLELCGRYDVFSDSLTRSQLAFDDLGCTWDIIGKSGTLCHSEELY